jgi:hypothetical protein
LEGKVKDGEITTLIQSWQRNQIMEGRDSRCRF